MAKYPSKINSKITFVLLAVILLTTGCRKADPELQSSKRLWQESKVTDYNFVIIRYQGGVYIWAPVLIQVRGGSVISALPLERVGELVEIDYRDFDTVEKTFRKIEKSHEAGDQITVTYNKEFGYPESVHVVPIGGGTDTQFTIEISKFEVIK
jgi:ADP-dependent phosphofructokinase/glucokinase